MTLLSKFGTLATLAMLGLAVAHPAAAQTAAFTAAATPKGGGAGNGNLNIGTQFTISGPGIVVSSLGVFDFGNDGLGASHTVTLFSDTNSGNTHTALQSVTVPSGGSATTSGFQFASLATPATLLPGNYSVIVYGLDGAGGNTDPYGENTGTAFHGDGNVSSSGFTVYNFTNDTSPTYPTEGTTNAFRGTSGAYLASSSFTYTDAITPTPEPSQAAMFGMGILGLAALVLKARKRSLV